MEQSFVPVHAVSYVKAQRVISQTSELSDVCLDYLLVHQTDGDVKLRVKHWSTRGFSSSLLRQGTSEDYKSQLAFLKSRVPCQLKHGSYQQIQNLAVGPTKFTDLNCCSLHRQLSESNRPASDFFSTSYPDYDLKTRRQVLNANKLI